jgi:hypothetical protein
VRGCYAPTGPKSRNHYGLTHPRGGRYPFTMRFRTLSVAALLLTTLACGEEDFLADPTVENEVETFTLGALRYSPLSVESGFQVSVANPVFTTGPQLSVDFLYDIDDVAGPAFLPAQAAGLLTPSATNPGFKRMDVAFDSILVASRNGYIVDEVIPIDSGDVFLVRSLIRCGIGVPHYGKLEVTGIDTVANTVTFKVLANQNCGYRSLEPGLPDN